MIEGTAKARISRAMNTKTLPAGETRNFRPGDLVDYYRKPGSKDTSGWKGPAKVVDITEMGRGILTVRFQRAVPINVQASEITPASIVKNGIPPARHVRGPPAHFHTNYSR